MNDESQIYFVEYLGARINVIFCPYPLILKITNIFSSSLINLFDFFSSVMPRSRLSITKYALSTNCGQFSFLL